jgi:cytochrome c oxidase subunit 3
MSTLLVALVTAVVVWVFLIRLLTAKPWMAVSEMEDIGPVRMPAVKIGLWVFLACITSLFALFITAYLMRMDPRHASDWYTIKKPGVLWLNTGLLILGSVAMQWARHAELSNNPARLKTALAAGGLFTLAFLAGQLYAWRHLQQSEYFDLVNPAVGFFYLLTAVHGLHLLGGLYVWIGTCARTWRLGTIDRTRLTVELCAVYWHYLLLVWFVLFGLLLST